MSEAEWRDDDDPRMREAFGYALRAHVNYQDGAHSEAPALVFADCDYEVGDGSCGLHEDGKRANEPAIVYVRADNYLALKAEYEKMRTELARASKPRACAECNGSGQIERGYGWRPCPACEGRGH